MINTSNQAGIAYSHETPQPKMNVGYYERESEKWDNAWHAAHCMIEDCVRCSRLCDCGVIISCDDCGRVHHTDWQGWVGQEDGDKVFVYCPECSNLDKEK
jgi:hypothetical protein